MLAVLAAALTLAPDETPVACSCLRGAVGSRVRPLNGPFRRGGLVRGGYDLRRPLLVAPSGCFPGTPSGDIVTGFYSWHANCVSAKQDFSCQSPLMIKTRGRNVLVRHWRIYASTHHSRPSHGLEMEGSRFLSQPRRRMRSWACKMQQCYGCTSKAEKPRVGPGYIVMSISHSA